MELRPALERDIKSTEFLLATPLDVIYAVASVMSEEMGLILSVHVDIRNVSICGGDWISHLGERVAKTEIRRPI